MTARRWIGYDWFKLIVAIILALLLLWLSLTSAGAPAAITPAATAGQAPTVAGVAVAPTIAAPTTAATTAPTTVPTTAATTAPTVAATIAATAVAAGAAPAITAPVPGPVPPGPLALGGTGAPGSTVEILDGDKALGTTTVGADGTWSYQVSPGAGPHTYGARAAGTTDSPATTVVIQAPAVEPPPVAGAAPAITSPVEGTKLGAGALTLSGTGTPGSKIEILDGDKLLGTVTVGADGTWSLLVTPSGGTASYGVRPAGATDIVGRPVRVTFEGATTQTCTSLAVQCDAWVTRAQGRGLRLRARPGTTQPIVEVLPIGTQMTLLEGPQQIADLSWWRVRTAGGNAGWVAGNNLVLQPD